MRPPLLSRTGHYLLTFGIVQIALSFAYGLGPSYTPGRGAQLVLLPRPVYLTVGVAAGLLAVVTAVHGGKRLRRLAFAALILPSAARSLAALASMAVTGYEAQQLTSALAFLFVVRVHLLIAGWPDPPPDGAVVLQADQLSALAEELRRRHEGGDER